ncbi:MAG: hypothetical protein ACYC3L_01165 [Gemmatimonadaceae bacterium]
MTPPNAYAAACERAALVLTHDVLPQHEDRSRAILADAALLRALATALRNGVAISQHGTDTRTLTQFVLTLPPEVTP